MSLPIGRSSQHGAVARKTGRKTDVWATCSARSMAPIWELQRSLAVAANALAVGQTDIPASVYLHYLAQRYAADYGSSTYRKPPDASLGDTVTRLDRTLCWERRYLVYLVYWKGSGLRDGTGPEQATDPARRRWQARAEAAGFWQLGRVFDEVKLAHTPGVAQQVWGALQLQVQWPSLPCVSKHLVSSFNPTSQDTTRTIGATIASVYFSVTAAHPSSNSPMERDALQEEGGEGREAMVALPTIEAVESC
ncbi:hypothetical protein CPLU01_04498 [Colletotrichum plurivorum]|uniref:Uncharacterized protein n=1 Tax=Colletotrichum plurivorum TaxID=2175906 RepID=A0A8H6KQH6_9PEZI|nr:hypothetical protein CPLU01_04498 [Colletotrichum plurivorum]